VRARIASKWRQPLKLDGRPKALGLRTHISHVFLGAAAACLLHVLPDSLARQSAQSAQGTEQASRCRALPHPRFLTLQPATLCILPRSRALQTNDGTSTAQARRKTRHLFNSKSESGCELLASAGPGRRTPRCSAAAPRRRALSNAPLLHLLHLLHAQVSKEAYHMAKQA